MYSSYAYPYSPNCDDLPKSDEIVLKGSDMALYAVFKSLNLDVAVRSILPDIKVMEGDYDDYDSDSGRGKMGPLVGKSSHARPGRIVITESGCHEDEVREWIQDYFCERRNITWITRPEWEGLGMVHGTVSRTGRRRSPLRQALLTPSSTATKLASAGPIPTPPCS